MLLYIILVGLAVLAAVAVLIMLVYCKLKKMNDERSANAVAYSAMSN